MQQGDIERIKKIISNQLSKFTFSKQKLDDAYTEIERIAAASFAKRYSEQAYNAIIAIDNPHDLQIDSLQNQERGSYLYENDITKIDSSYARLAMPLAVMTTVHEGTHYAQASVIQHLRQLSSVEEWCMNCLEKENRTCLGIETTADMYTYAAVPSTDYDLRYAHYKLQLMERQAVQASIEVGQALKFDTDIIELPFLQQINYIKNRYGLQSASNDELFRILDEARMKNIRNMQPDNFLEASVMYDIAALAFEDEQWRACVGNKHLETTAHIFNNDVKMQTLSEFGFEPNYMDINETQIDEQSKFNVISSFDAEYEEELERF